MFERFGFLVLLKQYRDKKKVLHSNFTDDDPKEYEVVMKKFNQYSLAVRIIKIKEI